MRLVRHGLAGAERPGLLDADTVRDLSGLIGDVGGEALSPEGLQRLRALDPGALPAVRPERFGPPVANVGKIVCIGLNYADHAAEAGMELPAEPIFFLKATSAICGPHDEVLIPRGAEKLDWEVELGVVIGSRASCVGEDEAMSHVAGYCIVNDVSERDFQLTRGSQWTKGKSADTFAPMGPWLVTADEVVDPQDLALWLDVGGERMQDGSTRTMVFGVASLVSYVSRFMSLAPGDVIATGTPPGVGMGRGRYLVEGEEMRAGIAGLGEQRNRIGRA